MKKLSLPALAGQSAAPYNRSMSILDIIRPLRTPDLSGFVKVRVASQTVGWTKRDFAIFLDGFDQTWDLIDDQLVLNKAFEESFETRTDAIDKTFMALSAKGVLPPMPDYSAFGGIDLYPLTADFDEAPVAAVKRFYAVYLGSKNLTVMINGYKGDHYWVARRGRTVHDEPGTLDVITAGAVDYRHTLRETLVEEAATEAGLEEADLKDLTSAGRLHLAYLTPKGFLRDEVFHVYDLDLGDKIPQTRLPVEVEGFQLLPIAEVIRLLDQGNAFKSQINMVIADFLLRHNHLKQGCAELKKFLYEERSLEEFAA